jgi:amino acid transporter
MFAFLLLHISVVWHFFVRHKSRAWWKHLAVPVIGFLILLYVVINAQVAAQTLGFIWLAVGVVLLLVLKATGREAELSAEEGL